MMKKASRMLPRWRLFSVAHVSAWSNSAGHIRDHSQSWSRCHALPKEIAAQLTTVNPEAPPAGPHT
ncbi:hypothetical protein F3Y22_tig00116997pilonHSYRG00169 [Hibiscus syriacus]|uniref:Uncharacterized protein n=1 Tax=Hibiscus syriacus TaxID=106335 RepID=A0A6A2WQW4_HIBSY|nr:hypothetical protein F3Y22_tig00116997pilonHSYRG00169 [Hibiscus syriacus]